MGGVGPLVSLHLDISEDHVLDGDGEPGHLPGDVSLPAAPGFRQVLQDGLHWLEIKVVIKMEIVEVLPVDEQVEHVVALPAHLQPGLHPV